MGILARNEPVDMEDLCRNAKVFVIFEAAGWTDYFQCLSGFHTETALQFALNLTETHSEVIGLRIEVTEEIVVEVTGLPQVGRTSFGRKTHNATVVQDFLEAGEQVCEGRRGIACNHCLILGMKWQSS